MKEAIVKIEFKVENFDDYDDDVEVIARTLAMDGLKGMDSRPPRTIDLVSLRAIIREEVYITFK